MKVEIFIPCFIDQFYPQTAVNMVKILEKLGCELNYNLAQTCCGQPAYNAGYNQQAKKIAEKFIKDFQNNDDFIVVPSASCVGMIRNAYSHLFDKNSKEYFAIQQRVFEFTEFITDILEVEKIEGAKLEGTATYHDSCSALRECQIKEAPRKLLAHVEGLELIELPENETCCGFGGTFAVKFPAISVAMAEQKIDNATSTQAQYLISSDASCLMHLEGYVEKYRKNIKTMHLIDVLAQGW
ncbi:MAG: (Fe-S)-binding protein [Cytophagales bacterium]|nr:MAG: (Fe-S)-binding protein [Cytophagales bacterium]